MLKETMKWLHEARDGIDTAQRIRTDISSVNVSGATAIHASVERAIKAPIVERCGGTLPNAHYTHKLETLARTIGLWSELNPDSQRLIREIEPFDPNTRYPDTRQYETLVSSSSVQEWDWRLGAGKAFIDEIEQDVLGNPTVLARLTV